MSVPDPPSESPTSFTEAFDIANLPVADVRLFAQLFDVSPFPAVVTRLSDHSVIAINRRTSEIFGISQREAVGQDVTQYYVNPAQRAELADRLSREGRADHLRLQIRRPDGTPFWALFSARLVTCDGEPAILTVFTDISDQVAAEDALRANEHRLAAQSRALTTLTARSADFGEPFDERVRHILRTCADTLRVDRVSLWRFDADRRAIRCLSLFERPANRFRCGAALQRSEAPAYFRAIEHERVVVAHDARSDPRTAEFRASYLDRFDIGAMLDVPLHHSTATFGVLCVEHVGDARTWTVDEQNFVISAGNLVAVAVADEERRLALARLADSESRATLIVDTAHDAFVGMDVDGRIAAWNAQAERTFGWTRDEAIGRVMADTIVPARFRDAHNQGIARFHASGEAPVVNQRLELAALHRDGHEFPIEITISAPIRTGDRAFFGAFLRDISERLERDAQLRVAKESAEAATRAKSEFLANMSHELRTPLNGVLGYAQLLQRDRTLTSAQREALEAITRSGAHLLDLINDVLDLSKIEAGRLEIETTPTDLDQLVLDLEYVVGDAARRRGLGLALDVADDVPRRVVIDGRHVRQVLLNLLGNAIKFTERGGVRLLITRAGDDRLAFQVTDTGIGIDPEQLDAIFAAFTQTPAGAAAGGSGLGLTISAHLVRRMGGQLRVDSTPGEGSRFHFALPVAEAAPPPRVDGQDTAGRREPALDARLAPGEHVTALVVDDSTVSRRILSSLLESAGVSVITAAGGFEAIGLARQHRPDIIFMDLRMNDLDGLEATRRLRADASTADIPIVAVTASAFGDAREAAREAGCNDYLPKPVRAQALWATIASHLHVRFVADAAAPEPGVIELSAASRTRLAARVGEALDIGNVTALDALARELAGGSAAEAAIGQRIARLSSAFDFEGLRALTTALASGGVLYAGD